MPQNDLAPVQDPGALIESVITKGDLGKLSAKERTEYYVKVCQSVGLNPFTKPLEYITLSGRLTLYARRDAADQLRKLNGVSVEVVSRKIEDDLCIVHVRAHDKTGRTDEDFGAVAVTSLRGEAKANAILKAITKAKRRVTLSISGLGFLDETEVDDIPAANKAIPPANTLGELDEFASVTTPVSSDTVDPETGEIYSEVAGDLLGDTEPPPERDLIGEARSASLRGTEAFRDFWVGLSQPERKSIRKHMAEFERAAKAADEPFAQEAEK